MDGYPNPARAQTAKTTSIAANAKKVALVSLTIGDSVSSASVIISIANRGVKNNSRCPAR